MDLRQRLLILNNLWMTFCKHSWTHQRDHAAPLQCMLQAVCFFLCNQEGSHVKR